MKSHAKRRGAAALLAGAALLFSAVAAYATTLLDDTFTRSVTDGWGTNWVVLDSSYAGDFDVDGDEGTVNVGGVGSTNQRVVNLTTSGGTYSALDNDITFDVKTDKLVSGTTGARYYAMLRLRRDTSSTCEYRVLVMPTLSTRHWVFRSLKLVSGTETYIDGGDVAAIDADNNVVTHTADTYLTARVQIWGTNPTTVRYKGWPRGTTEPSTWLAAYSDSESCLQDAGYPGLVFRLGSQVDNNPVLFTVDNFVYKDVAP